MHSPKSTSHGFTLIELVMVIVVLGIVSVGVGGFIRSGVQIFVDVSGRDQLLSQSRFVVERLNRELRTALPNSPRVRIVKPNNQKVVSCLEFVPIETSVFYTDIPVEPELLTPADVLELLPYTLSGGEFAVVYPTTTDHVYDATELRRIPILSCSDSDGNCAADPVDDDAIVQLEFGGTEPFAQDSPASRLYIVKHSVSYCVRNKKIYRHEGGTIQKIQTNYFTGGVLMAENLVNEASTDPSDPNNPFRVLDPSLNRNGIVYTLLKFDRDGEPLNFVNEVHIPNVP